MENRKFIILILLIGIILSPFFALGYSDETTHPALTKEAVSFFNYNFPDLALNEDEKELLMKGSIEEDTPFLRPLNHFYDPVYEVGLFGREMSAKKWAQDTQSQAGLQIFANANGFFSAEDDFSWDRAVYEYVHGEEERGLESLGHIVHLLEDMSVPPHTRDDSHNPVFGGTSPYEKWTKQFSSENFELAEEMIEQNKQPDIYQTVDEYFYNTALFTNNNFFSKDTIFDNKYIKPKLDDKNIRIIDGQNYLINLTDDIEFLLITYDTKRNKFGGKEKIYSIKDDDNLILSSYWDILSEHAVTNVAGLIKLFFDEVEKEKESLALLNKNNRWIAKMKEILLSNVAVSNPLLLRTMDVFDDVPLVEAIIPDSANSGEDSSGVTNLLQPEETVRDLIPNEINLDLLVNALDDAQKDIDNLNKSLETVNNKKQSQKNKTTNRTRSFVMATGSDAPAEPEPEPEILPEPEQESPKIDKDTTPPDAPTIITPTNFSEIFTSTEMTFTGTAELESFVSSDFSSATTTVDVDGKWTLSISANQGQNVINFYAVDEAGNKSSGTEVVFIVDSNSPDVSLNIDGCENQENCFLMTTELLISWNSSASDFSHFIIDDNGTTSTTIATSTISIAENNSLYKFSVIAVDEAGNKSQEIQKSVEISTSPVVINEIAWSGTWASPSDEWIELYNHTNRPISLDNWILYSEDNVPFLELSGTILPNDYYLIERGSDDVVADISADLVVPFSGFGNGSGLSNNGEHLILARVENGLATTTMDEVLKCRNWCAKGSSRVHRSMERYDPKVVGTDWFNWGTNDSRIRGGKNSAGGSVDGTPKARNSVSFLLNKNRDIENDLTLTKDKNPYFINDVVITVKEGATLTIEPGVVIKGRGRGRIDVKGDTVAIGTESEPIIFTSFLDDEFGGDTNNDGICGSVDVTPLALCPASGDWFGVKVLGTSENSSFENTLFRYGGRSYHGLAYSDALLTIDNASTPVSNSIFEYSRRYGLSLKNASSTISNNIFRYNDEAHGVAGIYGSEGAPVVRDNLFEHNRIGLYFSNSEIIVEDNVFNNNSYRAVIHSQYLGGYYSGNSGDSNGINGIDLSGGLCREGEVTVLKKNDLAYVLATADISVSASSTLQIDSGVSIKSNSKILYVSGRLEMNGEIDDRILFTSIHDDSDGNDIYGDGEVDVQTGGRQGIYMRAGSSSEIRNTDIKYMRTGITYKDSPINLVNVLFYKNWRAVSADLGSIVEQVLDVIFEGNQMSNIGW